MATPVEPKPAKYFIAFLNADLTRCAAVEAEPTARLGDIDARGAIAAWQESNFYKGEMGASLWRGFWSLHSPRSAAELAAAKVESQNIEDKFCNPVSGGRRVNLDTGYLDTLKVVLASTKIANQRIYLNSGIYAEAELFYHHGAFPGLPYTYPDYLTPQATEFLTRVRATYVGQRRLGVGTPVH